MASVGLDLDYDTMVLYRGRDFRWTFENLDINNEPEDFPDGELYFELATLGQENAVQSIVIEGAAGGTYTLSVEGQVSDAIDYDASELVVQDELEELTSVGAGNVQVTGYYVPQWIFTVAWSTPVELTPGTLQAFNKAINDSYDLVEFGYTLLGRDVEIDGEFTPTSFTVTVTARGLTLLEEEIVEFVANSVESTLNTQLSLVEPFTGNISDITEFYAPVRTMRVEFWGDLAETPIDDIVAVSSLTGSTPTIQVNTDARGTAPVTIWPFNIAGSVASLKVESEAVDLIQPRTMWQLVFLPDGEAAGGDPVGLGSVQVRGVPR